MRERTYSPTRRPVRRKRRRPPVWILLAIVLVLFLSYAHFHKSGAGRLSPPGKGTPTATPTPVPLSQVISIRLPDGSAAPMAVNGDTVVWAGSTVRYMPIPNSSVLACPQFTLFESSIHGFHPQPIWHTPSQPGVNQNCLNIRDVRISNQWIAWLSGREPGGVIYARSRTTLKTYQVAAQPPDFANDPCPSFDCAPSMTFSLSGDTIAWTHLGYGVQPDRMFSAVKSRRLPYGPIKSLYFSNSTCRMEIDPQISGRTLVWLRASWPRDILMNLNQGLTQQCTGALQTDVMSKNLRTGRVRQLTSSGQASSPITNGSRLLWLQLASNQSSNGLVYDLESAGGRGPAITLARNVADAKLSPSFVTWLSPGASSSRLYTENLAPGSSPILLTKAGSPSTLNFIRVLGWPEGRRIIWERDVVSSSTSTQQFIGIADISK